MIEDRTVPFSLSDEDVEAIIRVKVRRALYGSHPPLIAVRCPHCGNVLVRVSAGSAIEVRCIKCRTWIITTAA